MVDTFFSHENQPAPPSLSHADQLYSGMKSDLVTCLQTCITPSPPSEADISLVEEPVVERHNEDDDIIFGDEQPEEAQMALPVSPCIHEVFTDGPKVEVKLLDGAVIVNMLKPGTQRTFGEYTTKVFLPYNEKQLDSCERMDTVWDTYLPDSLFKSSYT